MSLLRLKLLHSRLSSPMRFALLSCWTKRDLTVRFRHRTEEKQKVKRARKSSGIEFIFLGRRDDRLLIAARTLAPENEKMKFGLLLLIENDVHTKITINQTRCRSHSFSRFDHGVAIFRADRTIV